MNEIEEAQEEIRKLDAEIAIRDEIVHVLGLALASVAANFVAIVCAVMTETLALAPAALAAAVYLM